jgi:hypothetical protein
MAAVRLCEKPLHIKPIEWPPYDWLWQWYGPAHFGTERAQVETGLEQLPGKQLAIVQYAPDHYVLEEWIYNGANIDDSKVIWAQNMDAAENLELIHYYKDRKVWLVQPDMSPAKVSPYPMPASDMNEQLVKERNR